MWGLKILGVDFYDIANWFYLYSFIGWIWETALVSFKNKRIVNRGFITGPLCTIYGCGAVGIYVLLHSMETNIILLFLLGAVFATVLEYCTAVIMEGIFHTSWWSYADQPLNFQGRICLGVSLGWGAGSVILIKILHPAVSFISHLYPREIGKWVIVAITIIYIFDFANSAIAASSLGQKLESLEKLVEDFAEYFQRFRISGTAEEFQKRFEKYKYSYKPGKFRERLREYMQTMTEKIDEYKHSDKKQEIEKQIQEFIQKYEKRRKKMGFVSERFLRAYPNLGKNRKLRLTKRNNNKNNEQPKETNIKKTPINKINKK